MALKRLNSRPRSPTKIDLDIERKEMRIESTITQCRVGERRWRRRQRRRAKRRQQRKREREREENAYERDDYEYYDKLPKIDTDDAYIYQLGDIIYAIRLIERLNVHKRYYALGDAKKFRCYTDDIERRSGGKCIVSYKVKLYDITSYLNLEHSQYFHYTPPSLISNINREDVRTHIIDTIWGIESQNEEWH